MPDNEARHDRTDPARHDRTNETRHDGTDPPPDALRRLEERLDRAARAAERLIAEAREQRSSTADKPPPAGWEAPRSESQDGTELELLAQLIQSVRELVPADLQRRLADALRELLLALRALIDYYLERLEQRGPVATEMEDIPIS
jgi:hypothetical protein